MRAAEKMSMLFISANRDDRHFPEGDIFGIRRNPTGHLGFGGGLHACLGAALAQLEAKIAYEELLRMMPGFAVDESQPLKRAHSPPCTASRPYHSFLRHQTLIVARNRNIERFAR